MWMSCFVFDIHILYELFHVHKLNICDTINVQLEILAFLCHYYNKPIYLKTLNLVQPLFFI